MNYARTGTSEDLFQRDAPLIWRHQHYMKLSKLSSYQRMHCPSSDCHLIEERNKIHRLIAWEWIWGRKSRPNKRGVTRELSKKYLAKPEMHFNIGKVWNPVCCHGNKTVKLKPCSIDWLPACIVERKIVPATQLEVKWRKSFATADSMAVLGGRARIFRRTDEKKRNSWGVPLLTSKHGN